MRPAPPHAWRALFLLLAALPACAPIYAPSALHVPMLRGAGDVHLDGQLGLGGGQLDAAVAITKHLALRGTGQYQAPASDPKSPTSLKYTMGSGGVGWYWASGGSMTAVRRAQNRGEPVPLQDGLRAEVDLEGGGGHESGRGTIGSGSSQLVAVSSGPFLRFATQASAGYEGGLYAVALAARLTYLHEQFDPTTTYVPGQSSDLMFLEPAAILRVGPRQLRGELQLGLSIPVDGFPTGLWSPFLVSLGLGGNF